MRTAKSELAGTGLVALAAAGWGTWALFLRGSGLSPSWQCILILAVIAVATTPTALARSRERRDRTGWRSWGRMALLGAVDAANYITYFGALDRGPIAVAVLTHYLAPVVVAAAAPFYLREPLGRRTPAALFASLAGLSLLVLGGASRSALPAALLGTASAFFYGGNTLLSKRLLRNFSAVEVAAFHSWVAAAALAAFAPWPPPAAISLARPLAGALLLGAAGSTLFYSGLRRIPAQRAAVLTYLEPVVAAAVGAVAFGEHLDATGLLGAALILAAGAAVVLEGEPATAPPQAANLERKH